MQKKDKKQYTCIIPVRFSSTRFPGKPFAKICGKPMLHIVWTNANKAKMVDKVLIAAYDKEIYDFCKKHSIDAIKVSKSCKNGSEAVADAARKINASHVFEMQGDQPLVTPDIIDYFLNRASSLVAKDPAIDVAHPYTVCGKAATNSLDVLNVVVTRKKKLIFQTRQPINTGYRTLGLYLWNKESLVRFAKLPVSRIENSETSHPIRLYINDFNVQGIPISGRNWIEVDRAEQVPAVEAIMRKRKSKSKS